MAGVSDGPNLAASVVAEQTHLSLASYPHWIEAAAEFLRRKAVLAGACDEARSGKLMIVFHEALSNAIIHGNLELSSLLKEQAGDDFAESLARRVGEPTFVERRVDVVIDCNVDRCKWRITDQGQGFDVQAVTEARLQDEPDVVLASGRGLLIMSSFVDDMAYELGGRRLVLTLRRENGVEKRHEPRVFTAEQVRVAPILPDGAVDWEAAREAVARDLSAGGTRVLLDRLAGTERILIGISNGERMLYVPAEVRHCRSLAENMFELGCRFQTGIEKPEATASPTCDGASVQQVISAVMASHQARQPAAVDSRAHQRAPFTERVEVFMHGKGESIPAFARDLSKGGIAFLTTRYLAGEITIRFAGRADSGSATLRACVVRCNKIQEGFFDVGARFLQVEDQGAQAGS